MIANIDPYTTYFLSSPISTGIVRKLITSTDLKTIQFDVSLISFKEWAICIQRFNKAKVTPKSNYFHIVLWYLIVTYDIMGYLLEKMRLVRWESFPIISQNFIFFHSNLIFS